MALQVVEAGSRLRLERGQAVVCIPVFNAADHFARCLTSVATHAGEATQVLIADDASTDPAIERIARDVGERFPDLRLAYRRNEENLGFVRNLNNVFAMTAPADVVILNSDCVVTEGWLDGMRDAAYSDSRVATVSSLT